MPRFKSGVEIIWFQINKEKILNSALIEKIENKYFLKEFLDIYN